MKEVEKIDKEIEELKSQYKGVKGRQCEIFTRICGYHRDTKRWNAGKDAERKQRVTYKV